MYRTYSQHLLGNLNAQALNDSVTEDLIDPLPVDGDAHQRELAAMWPLSTAAKNDRP